MYHSSLLAQRLKGNTVNINVLKLCGWELHDFLAQNKERLTFHALYSHHFLPAYPVCGKGERDQPHFSTDCSYYGNEHFFHPPQDDHQGIIINEKEFQTLLSHTNDSFRAFCFVPIYFLTSSEFKSQTTFFTS